jgi:cysteine synthase
MIKSTLEASNILGKYASGQRRMPAIFAPSSGTTAEEIWQDTEGKITHFVSAMGTTGTIMGVSTTLKAKNSTVQIVGVQPEDGAKIAGIRRWPEAYLPKIFDASKVDLIMDVSQTAAEQTSCLFLSKNLIFRLYFARQYKILFQNNLVILPYFFS